MNESIETVDEDTSDESDDESDESLFDESMFGENDGCESSGGGEIYNNDVVLMILTFYLRHNLTWAALEHLLQLVNEISLGTEPTTKYLFSKLLPTLSKPTYHYYCQKCNLYFGKKEELIRKYGAGDVKCTNCENKGYREI